MRRDRLIKEYEHDTYKSRSKPPEPTVCTECGAAFHKGRWQWVARPDGAHNTLCPACHRIHGKCPGSYLTLSGAFQQQHHDEILHLARNIEAPEKAEHSLCCIMALEEQDDSMLITTTSMAMARSIGDALQRAYKGEVGYQYTDEANILHVNWKR